VKRYCFPAIALLLIGAASAHSNSKDPFAIRVVDESTGRGVPLVELRTVHEVRYYTDSNGIVAFSEPGLMGQTVFFHIRSHGYEFPKDGFGNRGTKISIAPGGSVTLRIKRLNIAERLYRVTGGGIYRDSVLVGRPTPLREPLLNGQVLGSDGVVNALYHSKVYWFWGDTNRAAYPLGNFNVTGATSMLPEKGGLDPEVGIDLTYFTGRDGFVRPMAPMPGDGPTWIDGLVVLRDQAGKEHMFAAYVKVRGPLTVYARGLAEFDDVANQFRQAAEFQLGAPAYPGGHPFLYKDHGEEYVYFATAYPLTRVRATPEALKDLAQYQTYTCLQEGSTLEKPKVERSPTGKLVYAWKKNAPVVSPVDQEKLTWKGFLRPAGFLGPREALLQLRDRDSGKAILAHFGSVSWNAYRRRWLMIAVESGGTSSLGEVWYAEADEPTGPWTYAVKVVTHERYSFYNPKQHPLFDKDGGRVIFFEGTYSQTFSGNTDPTPRYDYNQVMYKLDLADQRLALPVPVYRSSSKVFNTGQGEDIAFYALDRPAQGMVPVYEDSNQLRLGAPLMAAQAGKPAPLFYALPPDTPSPPNTTTFLREFRHRDGTHAIYATQPDPPTADYQPVVKPLFRIWRDPRAAEPK
jgi:hypothetical protein